MKLPSRMIVRTYSSFAGGDRIRWSYSANTYAFAVSMVKLGDCFRYPSSCLALGMQMTLGQGVQASMPLAAFLFPWSLNS